MVKNLCLIPFKNVKILLESERTVLKWNGRGVGGICPSPIY